MFDMLKKIKILLFFGVFCSGVIRTGQSIDANFALPLIQMPTSAMIQAQADGVKKRDFKRIVCAGATGVAVICVFLWATTVKERFDELIAKEHLIDAHVAQQKAAAYVIAAEKQKLIAQGNQDSAMALKVSQQDGFLKQAVGLGWNYTKFFGLTCSRSLAQVTMMTLLGSFVNNIYSMVSNKLQKTYAPETVLWFVQEQTKIATIFQDLKSRAISYDLYATILSCESFNKDAQVSMKSFMQDVSTVCMNMNNQVMEMSPGYVQYMIDELKKKHTRNGTTLDKRYEYVLDAIIQSNQLKCEIPDIEHSHEQDVHRRKDIALLCKFLIHHVQDLVSFIEFKNCADQKDRLQYFIDVTNQFIESMQRNLQADQETLHALSMADHGMFTNVYNYEKFFLEEMNFIHRYCR